MGAKFGEVATSALASQASQAPALRASQSYAEMPEPGGTPTLAVDSAEAAALPDAGLGAGMAMSIEWAMNSIGGVLGFMAIFIIVGAIAVTGWFYWVRRDELRQLRSDNARRIQAMELASNNNSTDNAVTNGEHKSESPGLDLCAQSAPSRTSSSAAALTALAAAPPPIRRKSALYDRNSFSAAKSARMAELPTSAMEPNSRRRSSVDATAAGEALRSLADAAASVGGGRTSCRKHTLSNWYADSNGRESQESQSHDSDTADDFQTEGGCQVFKVHSLHSG